MPSDTPAERTAATSPSLLAQLVLAPVEERLLLAVRRARIARRLHRERVFGAGADHGADELANAFAQRPDRGRVRVRQEDREPPAEQEDEIRLSEPLDQRV